ncbi:unnamed protein product, partial [Didymodactylos carnosus]
FLMEISLYRLMYERTKSEIGIKIPDLNEHVSISASTNLFYVNWPLYSNTNISFDIECIVPNITIFSPIQVNVSIGRLTNRKAGKYSTYNWHNETVKNHDLHEYTTRLWENRRFMIKQSFVIEKQNCSPTSIVKLIKTINCK